jgi:hypothetical protein
MAYPGFEPGPPRSEVRRANHCAIGAPIFEVSRNQDFKILRKQSFEVSRNLGLGY